MLLHQMFGLPYQKYEGKPHRWSDLFGVELELEGVRNAKPIDYWTTHDDGSLRQGIEYVLEAPTGGDNLQAALDSYYAAKIKSASSERASTHIHINMSDAVLDNLRTMVMIMYVLEGPLFLVVGEARKWGGYSMALSEMEPSRLGGIMQETVLNRVPSYVATGRNTDRYYGFNVSSVRKYGSAEFRYFPGDPSREELEAWLDFVLAIKQAGVKYTTAQLMDRINTPEDWIAFMDEILPRLWFHKLMGAANMDDMYNDFNNISAVTTVNTSLDPRREPLIFLNGPLLKFATNKLVGKEGAAYLRKVGDELQVVTENEWKWHIRQAMRQGKPEESDIVARDEADYAGFLEIDPPWRNPVRIPAQRPAPRRPYRPEVFAANEEAMVRAGEYMRLMNERIQRGEQFEAGEFEGFAQNPARVDEPEQDEDQE